MSAKSILIIESFRQRTNLALKGSEAALAVTLVVL